LVEIVSCQYFKGTSVEADDHADGCGSQVQNELSFVFRNKVRVLNSIFDDIVLKLFMEIFMVR